MKIKTVLIALLVSMATLYCGHCFAQAGACYLNQGEFAINLVKMMRLERYLPLASTVYDNVTLLEGFGIRPLEGWDINKPLSRADYVVIMALASGKESVVHDKAKGACEANIGVINLKLDLKHIVDGKWPTLDELFSDTRYFPNGPPKCPYGLSYHDKDGDHKVDSHNHPGKSYFRAKGARGWEVEAKAKEEEPAEEKSAEEKAAEERPAPKPSERRWQEFADRLSFSMGLATEYDDNIFFDEQDNSWDVKTTFSPTMTYLHTMDKVLFMANYRNDSAFYRHRCAWTHSHMVDNQFRLRLTKDFSIGVKDTHIHQGQSELSLRVLRTGYDINTFVTTAKYQLSDSMVLDSNYQHDYIDFSDTSIDNRIDRRSDDARSNLEYWIDPNTSAYAGYRWKLVKYNEMMNKDFKSIFRILGFRRKLGGLFSLSGETSWEQRDFADFERDSRPNWTASLSSIFSRYTNLSLLYGRNWSDSSRREFKQYTSEKVATSFRHYITPKLIASSSFSYEKQRFRDADRISLSSVIEPGNRRTYTYTTDVALRQTLTDNISVTLGYNYSKKDSDFRQEGYSGNKVRFTTNITF